MAYNIIVGKISIHALLAESDQALTFDKSKKLNFYPRSPCGERLKISFLFRLPKKFLSTLSLRRATDWPPVREIIQWISIHALLAESDRTLECTYNAHVDFYPRSPCGERQDNVSAQDKPAKFLSTLSLRRATGVGLARLASYAYFYPRSPCGERQQVCMLNRPDGQISIHALLAESDAKR